MVEATQRYHLTFPAHNNKVVQKFYLDFKRNKAYALQMKPGNTTDMQLYIADFNENDPKISFAPYMSLNNFGHGQTFEVFTDNSDGSLWAWVATKVSPTETDGKDGQGDHWASRIGVIPLDGTDKDADSVHSITYLNYMGTGNHKNLSLHRTDAALSSTDGRLAIWTQGSGSVATATKRVTAFNANKLFKALKNGNISAKGASMNAGGEYYVSTHDISSFVYPQSSWQGMELSNMTGFGYNWVYLTSGQLGDQTKIVRAPWNFKSHKTLDISINDLSDIHETEALQLYGSNIYFGIEERADSSHNHYIYSIAKDSF